MNDTGMHETVTQPVRVRRILGWLFGGLALAAAGCSPPPTPTTDDELAVEMPDAKGVDGGESAAFASLDPPYLTDVESPGESQGGDSQSSDSQSGDPARSSAATEGQAAPSAKIASAPSADPSSTSAEEPAAATPTAEYDPDQWRKWPTPDVTLVVTGQQNGYIEPCGCTGLDRQKGGVARRFTFMKQLRDKGWSLLPIDAGNQVRRFGRQAEIKLQQSVKAMQLMDYQAIGFGPEDLRLGVGELLAVAAGDSPDDTMFASANVVLIDPSLMPKFKIVEVNGIKVGITSILDPSALETQLSDDITLGPKERAAMESATLMKESGADFRVLMFFGKEEDAKKLVQDVPGFDLVVAAGGYGEPTYQPEEIENARTRMIVTGNKGMYAGLVGIYKQAPLRYARVALTHEFEDAPEMRQVMKEYQDQLRDIGLQGLGLLPPIPHGSGQKFVGTAKCAECHTTAFDIWSSTPHAVATDDIVMPPKERGDIARHFDPECLSCHVTGWNPQEYYPYESGYLTLEGSKHLHGSGCENCHGPGSEHSAAEVEGSQVSDERREELRQAMILPLEKAREKCMTCHDLDNSPDFHEEDAFEDVYWPEVEHYGLD